jgi:4-hydroxybenzoate polyprenyltransferase
MLVVSSQYVAVHLSQVVLIVVALVSARTAAMAFNRLIDIEIDSRNPRTATRELPAGKLSVLSVWTLFLTMCVVFFGSAWGLGQHCLVLAPLVLFVLTFYSWTKRFTWLCHYVLGAALACAPGGVWYAVAGTFEVLPLTLMAGVTMWVAGFDILYSCQDVSFDKKEGLHSVPVRFGVPRAFQISQASHLLAIIAFILFGLMRNAGLPYFTGLTLFSVFLLSQHCIVSPKDLRRIDVAFFTKNGAASVVFFLGVLAENFLTR